MKLDALIEARVRLGEEVPCPHGCGTMLRVWATHTGLTERVINCSSLACATKRMTATFRASTSSLREFGEALKAVTR
ncbi:hypothetical protein LCGC14_1398410 [marine sediment metagenome]|uniref:Uncharacterized protein n=1 Tax=marine sediment metagenome TaxID=412755 RepID=A0A0F9KIQ3_9ZZZZ